MKRTCEKITAQIRDEAVSLLRQLAKLPDADAPGLDTAILHLRNAAASLRAARLAVEGAALATSQGNGSPPINAFAAAETGDDDAA